MSLEKSKNRRKEKKPSPLSVGVKAVGSRRPNSPSLASTLRRGSAWTARLEVRSGLNWGELWGWERQNPNGPHKLALPVETGNGVPGEVGVPRSSVDFALFQIMQGAKGGHLCNAQKRSEGRGDGRGNPDRNPRNKSSAA